MIVLAGGDIVLPDRVVPSGSLVVEHDRIVAVEADGRAPDPAGATRIDVSGTVVVPGFIDVHVHGVEGHDTLDAGEAIATIARRLPRHGVTAFCPTTVACGPHQLRAVLDQVSRARVSPVSGAARVLPAHLESNFINPEFNGAQPVTCLRSPDPRTIEVRGARADDAARASADRESDFSAADILDVIATARPDVGIVTLAPELPGGLDLVRALVAAGHRVSLGHSGADFDTAMAAIEAGARHATHLFNRMPPLSHRAPGLAGAVLASEAVAAELICDGFHVHPAVARMAIAAKGVARTIAITDGTAGAGLPPGSVAQLGGRDIYVREQAAFLPDGTLAGSTLTMERAFETVVTRFGRSLVDAAMMCSTTPARELGLTGIGVIAPGAIADLTVLDRDYTVTRTFIGGVEVYRRGAVA